MKPSMAKLALAGLCCGALACGQNKVVGSAFVKSQLISASQGGEISVSASDDKNLAGTDIKIPPKALAQDTTITITEGTSLTLPQGVTLESPLPVAFGPSGTTFALPVTLTLPATAHLSSPPEVIAVEDDGTTTVVGSSDVVYDANAGTVSIAAASFTRFAAIGGTAVPCPKGETLCGCNGGGRCVPAGVLCPALCPPPPPPGGGLCCPAGEYFCGCEGHGTCVPDTLACAIDCPLQLGANGSAQPTSVGVPPPASCCPPGQYYCGCNGGGPGCIDDSKACDTLCPPPGGSSGGSGGGGCCPDGEYFCGCPGETGSCIPVGQSCVVACPALPGGSGSAAPPPGSPLPPTIDCCPPGDVFCGCNGVGSCIPSGQACSLTCPSTGGGSGGTGCTGPLPPCATGQQPICQPNGQWTCGSTSGGGGGGGCVCACPATGPCDCSCDGGVACPANEVLTACGCLPPDVMCVPPPPGSCPQGETDCCGQCLPAGQACTAMCVPLDAGAPPPCACACPANDPTCVCGCGDGGTVTGGCGPNEQACCDGTCVPDGLVCPDVCIADGGGYCANGYLCPDGTCVPPGAACPIAADAGCACACPAGSSSCSCDCTVCPRGYDLCCGQCQPDTLACPALCPVLDGGSGYGCGGPLPPCPTGEQPVCTASGWTCSGGEDAGCVCACPAGSTNCGCGCGVQDGGPAPSPDGGSGCVVCPVGDYWCGCTTSGGSCIPNGQGCAVMCPQGAYPPTCNPCPSGEYECPDGKCIPQGAMCTSGGADAGNCASSGSSTSCCPQGYAMCNGKCIVDTLVCAADAG